MIAVAEAIPFAELTQGSHERLYEPQGARCFARGIRQVTGLNLPVFPKRRFQHGAAPEEVFVAGTSQSTCAVPPALPEPLRARVARGRRLATVGPRAPPHEEDGGSLRRRIAHFWEEERTPEAGDPALTIFLAGAECPFTCVFCDLWRETLDGPTPPGALPAQLREALAAAGPLPQPVRRLKLYNASNFFEPRAVPMEDEDEILALVAPFARVTVECHPRLVGGRCLRFAERLTGRLEVAMGLETVHPEALPRLNKGLTLDGLRPRAATLRGAGSASAPSCWWARPSCRRRRRSSGRSAPPTTPSSKGRSASR